MCFLSCEKNHKGYLQPNLWGNKRCLGKIRFLKFPRDWASAFTRHFIYSKCLCYSILELKGALFFGYKYFYKRLQEKKKGCRDWRLLCL